MCRPRVSHSCLDIPRLAEFFKRQNLSINFQLGYKIPYLIFLIYFSWPFPYSFCKFQGGVCQGCQILHWSGISGGKIGGSGVGTSIHSFVQGEDITDLAVLWSLEQEEIPTTLISTASRCRQIIRMAWITECQWNAFNDGNKDGFAFCNQECSREWVRVKMSLWSRNSVVSMLPLKQKWSLHFFCHLFVAFSPGSWTWAFIIWSTSIV